MMKFKRLIALFLFSSLLFSCTSTYQYGPGCLGVESRVFLTPVANDTAALRHYAGGRYFFNLGKGYNEAESNRFGEVNYHLGYTHKLLTCAAGISAFAGSYEVLKFETEKGWKNFYGCSAMGQAALNIPLGSYLNWRILGIRGGFSLEDGDMYNFRIRNRAIPGFNEIYDRRLIWNAGGYSELIFEKNGYRAGFLSSNTLLLGNGKMLGLASAVGANLGRDRYTLSYQYSVFSHGNSGHNVGMTINFY